MADITKHIIKSIKTPKELTHDEIEHLNHQNTRLVSQFKALDLEKNALKYWDLFYKRNETKFFKDRHWTTREFCELLGNPTETKTVLEVGCGVGNLIYPLLEENPNFKFIACDLSPRAVDFVEKHKSYNEECVRALQADVTQSKIVDMIGKESVDVASMVFVLSAIHPDKFGDVLGNVREILNVGGLLLFRDYGLHDMAQLRFKAGHKIAENFYMRQDGTRSYYFSLEFLENLLKKCGFEIVELNYIRRRTINKKENIDVPRTFVQGKFRKPD